MGTTPKGSDPEARRVWVTIPDKSSGHSVRKRRFQLPDYTGPRICAAQGRTGEDIVGCSDLPLREHAASSAVSCPRGTPQQAVPSQWLNMVGVPETGRVCLMWDSSHEHSGLQGWLTFLELCAGWGSSPSPPSLFPFTGVGPASQSEASPIPSPSNPSQAFSPVSLLNF